jgi:hypothetical protein
MWDLMYGRGVEDNIKTEDRQEDKPKQVATTRTKSPGAEGDQPSISIFTVSMQILY